MAKFGNARPVGPPGLTSPVTSTGPARTAEGGHGYARDAKSELFLLAVVNLVGEDTFYEAGDDRDDRFVRLVHQVTADDPAWVARFVPYLREALNLRSASVVMAAEYARALLAGQRPLSAPSPRSVVASALVRPDEPAELIAYWTARYGRQLPMALKRGAADAIRRLYTERAALKYDGQGRAWRMGDVIELTHPKPTGPEQAALFAWLLDRRHHPDSVRADLGQLPMVAANRRLQSLPQGERRALLGQPDRLAEAGMTWESLAGWLGGPMDAAAWTAVLPSMGYMARLRNLRNLDQAGVADDVAAEVAASLADPARVARSRQLPFRFHSAYKAAPSERWSLALERALQASVANVPALPGRTLVLVDTSASMQMVLSRRGTVSLVQVAALFGVVLATRSGGVDLVGYATGSMPFRVPKAARVLNLVTRFEHTIGQVGHGTETARALRDRYAGHDRVIVITDGQAFWDPSGSVDHAVPADVPLYTFNTMGYRVGHARAGAANRHELGGLSDAAFTAIAALEERRNVGWPF
jgi:hypothetical protein